MKNTTRTSALASVVLAAGLVAVPAAQAAPVAAPAAVTVQTKKIGDGTWVPSHDEKLAIIPICGGPVAVLDWLNKNFTDHGNDLGKFLKSNGTFIKRLVSGASNPYEVLRFILMPFLQVPVYAVNDTVFHIPATLGDILSFCSSNRR